MSLITYVPAPGYDSSEQGVLNMGGGAAFDVHAALAAGGGVITVDSAVSRALINALDSYPGLVRSGSSPGPISNVDVIGPIIGHSKGSVPGYIYKVGADGLAQPTDPLLSGTSTSGMAQLGTDGTVGGPGGSPITGPVALGGAAVGNTAQVAVYNGFVYWTDRTSQNIGRMNLDGSGLTLPFVTTGAGTVWGLVVGPTGIYWTDQAANTIGHANLDGTGVNNVFMTGWLDPEALCVDANYLYFSYFSGTSFIGRANLDGTAQNGSFIVGNSHHFHDIATDGTYLYWSEDFGQTFGGIPNGGQVARANLDGTGVNHTFIDSGVYDGPTGIATDGTYIYWADYGQRGTVQGPNHFPRIGRAKVDGTDIRPGWIILPVDTTGGSLWGIAYANGVIYAAQKVNLYAVPIAFGGSSVNSGALATHQDITAAITVAQQVTGFFDKVSQSVRNGPLALISQTTGTFNTANGYGALQLVTTGSTNTATGWGALAKMVMGSNNSAFGHKALNAATAGPNSAFGYTAGALITTAINNVAVGSQALAANIVGNNNVAVGVQALQNTTAANNVAVGYQALIACTSGAGNVALGRGANNAITTTSFTTALGYQTQATAAGAVALGADHTGASATTAVQDQIALGTSAHHSLFSTAVDPGAAALAAGQFTFWLDPTNGAAVLNVRAKQADGTTRTAQIALT